MFEHVAELVAEHAALERDIADPALHSDQARARKVNRRYAELTPVVRSYTRWRQLNDDIEAARELALEDSAFRDEVATLEGQRDVEAERLRELLVPRDPDDDRDVIVEVKAGEGGEESALFAGDLVRMYLRYAEKQGWKTEILGISEGGGGNAGICGPVLSSRSRPGGGLCQRQR